MQQAQPSSLIARQQRTLRLAWTVLLAAFLLFCGLLAWAALLAWNYYVAASDAQESTLIVRSPLAEWITWQPHSRTIFQRAADQQRLQEGDQVRIATSAGYGQVATIRLFDQSTLDMWARADVRLETLQTSRWTDSRQTVILRQSNGYVRYDLRADQPFRTVLYRVLVGGVSVDLAPGGSYSIELRPTRRMVHPVGRAVSPAVITDVAVRSGHASIRSADRNVSLLPGQRIEIDSAGMPALAIPARWELIRDGAFHDFTEPEYNNTTVQGAPALPRSQTWIVYGTPSDVDASGYFKISESCQPPNTRGDCDPQEQRKSAWFIRSGKQTRSFTTGIYQDLGVDGEGVDISEYRSLVFSAWVRVFYQSIPLTGDQGTECPIMIRFLGKRSSPTNPEEERVICTYTAIEPEVEPAQWPGIKYYRAEPYEWYELRIELRDPDWLPDFRYLKGIQIYANGHDYDSRVTGVSLIGSHYAPVGE